MKRIAVYDKDTGFIKQVVTCSDVDADKQHTLHPEHDYIDITDHPLSLIDPDKFAVSLTTGELVEQAKPLSDLQKKYEANSLAGKIITGGFTSSALGEPREYPSGMNDQTNMLHAAQVGGCLWSATKGEWEFQAHTADQARQVLADFVVMKDAALAPPAAPRKT